MDTPPESNPEQEKKPPHILILEDDESHAELIRRGFSSSSSKYRLTFVGNLKDARTVMEMDSPDLIIADWLLPDGKGIDILPVSSGHVTTPLVITTSHGNETLAVGLMKSGAMDYVVKSDFTFREMPHIAERALREWNNIQQRKAAEDALRQSEARLRNALEGANEGLWVWDIPTGEAFFGPRYYTMMGFEPGEFPATAESWSARIHPDDRMWVLSTLQRQINERQEFYDIEYRILTKNNEIRWIHARGKTVDWDSEGNVIRMAGTNADVTDRKNAEESLKKSEVRFRSLIQNSSDIIRILNADGIVSYDSPSSERILGYPAGFFIGKNPLDYIHPDDAKRVRQDLAEVRARKNPMTPTEFRILKSDGSYIYVESIAINLLDEAEIGGIVVTTRPVHERKLAEMSLRESEERFRQIFDKASDAIFVTEVTAAGMPGRFLDANAVMCSRLGYTREEFRKMSAISVHPRQDATTIHPRMMELFARGETTFESGHITKEGGVIPVELTAHLIRIKERSAIIWVARDITQRKQEEKALRLANQKLQLMNIVAWHDIQNKVTGLRGYVELSKDLITDPRAQEFVTREEEVLRTIYEHIQYTKEYQEIGKEPLQWVDVPAIIRQSLAGIEKKEIAVLTDINNLEIYCDPIIRKVFSHLVENSIVHGKTTTKIRISSEEVKDHLVIVYEDNGVGIPAKNKESIFVRDVGKGSGFSLFFIHDILELSGMDIRETGEPGKGARFEITVPKGSYRFSFISLSPT
jgi:PAS domain S-box-containing protein